MYMYIHVCMYMYVHVQCTCMYMYNVHVDVRSYSLIRVLYIDLFELSQSGKRSTAFSAPGTASYWAVEVYTPTNCGRSSFQRLAEMTASYVHTEAGRAGQLFPTSFNWTLDRSTVLKLLWRGTNLYHYAIQVAMEILTNI